MNRVNDTEYEKLYDDVYTEIGLALGWDDGDDYTVDIKRIVTDAIMRSLGSQLLAAESKLRAVGRDHEQS